LVFHLLFYFALAGTKKFLPKPTRPDSSGIAAFVGGL